MKNIKRYDVERDENWREWIKKIPFIKFNPSWKVKIIPPFGGAMVRFIVEHNGESASVYLDCFDNLGYMNNPYWEVYPVDGDTGRVLLDDIDGLIKLIKRSLSKRKRSGKNR